MIQTIWVPGHPGWAGQQKPVTGLIVIGVIFGIVIIGYGAILLSDGAAAMMLLGAAVIVTVGLTGWMLAAHLRVSRVRVVRAEAAANEVVFRGVAAIVWPLRLFLVAGLAILGGWAWAIATVPAERLSILTLLLVPVIGAILAIMGARAWFQRPGGHRLTLTPAGIDLQIPRTGLRASWNDVASAELAGDRVVVRAVTAKSGSWAARDLASDPVILAELIAFYARSAPARDEIGSATLDRLRSGGF
ncbi:hypothetical protein [Microbacterium sp.]|uniref:hypothetical protein n=1 Tax=Microbacterium sp. TaxID=51671 RepID=UPI003F9E792D